MKEVLLDINSIRLHLKEEKKQTQSNSYVCLQTQSKKFLIVRYMSKLFLPLGRKKCLCECLFFVFKPISVTRLVLKPG